MLIWDVIFSLEGAARGSEDLDMMLLEFLAQNNPSVTFTELGLRPTRSLDAIATLVPRGWVVGILPDGRSLARLGKRRAVIGPTPALALCVAYVRSLLQTSTVRLTVEASRTLS
jgi:hypothetical protein